MNVPIAIVWLALASGASVREAPEDLAEKSALAWLARVDAGSYEESWTEAASFFRGAVSKEDWKKAMEGVRRPLGKVLSRKVKSRTYAESLPGAPDGKYVIVVLDTSFENKKTAVETVTPMQEPDGTFRVSGYFIK
jgi:hypothetical protein